MKNGSGTESIIRWLPEAYSTGEDLVKLKDLSNPIYACADLELKENKKAVRFKESNQDFKVNLKKHYARFS